MGRALAFLALMLASRELPAQLTTGQIECTVLAADGRRLPGAPVSIAGGAGFRALVHAGANGVLWVTLPYGRYTLSGAEVFVAALETTHIDLVITGSGEARATTSRAWTPGLWDDDTRGRRFPEGLSLTGTLMSREPSSVTVPLDFTGLSDNRLAVESERAFSWTETQFRIHGMDATDSYQPGFPAAYPEVEALEQVVVSGAFAQAPGSGGAADVGLFFAEPRASWHGALSTADTGSALSSDNLPAPAERGLVRQTQLFRWLTRNRFEIGGALGRRADIYASGAAQWASQTEPLAAPGTAQASRLLFGNVRGRVRAGARDRLDTLYSGSRINLSDGGVPAGLEALTGNRMAPSFVLPGGFSGQKEVDHLDTIQVGWTHLLPTSSGAGALEVRYAYSIAHLDTGTAPSGTSRIELLGGTVTGAPPLANLAVRPRHEIAAAWQPVLLEMRGSRHRILAGGDWEYSEPRNRFDTPSGMNLVTAGGAPAFIAEFNTPLDSREIVQSFRGYLADQLEWRHSLSVDLGVMADFSRGSLPAQSSPGGVFSAARAFAAQPGLIAWNSISPRAGFAWQVPHSHGLVLRGLYFRMYAPLAGRYLDYGNPNSLGGSLYQWITTNPGIQFTSAQQGSLLARFGGPYSSISPSLGRPYSDEFDVAAEFRPGGSNKAGVHLFRRDDKDRIAALDTAVPASAFTPVSILDPGPDGIPGTFDDQRLTVYAQNPATLGQDRYLLTNPPGLRMLHEGLVAEAATAQRGLELHVSFVAEKSFGPTNPGDAFYENDPGVIGALLQDPNTANHAAGRSFVDRAFVGKLQAIYRLPRAAGGLELASVAGYTDGLVFARQLLVTGLPQGPFLVATTVRGSPEGGNRAQYVTNWNLRLARGFDLRPGRLTISADLLNATNAAQRLQESDLSGPAFNLRLPVAIQPPRMLRVGVRYEF